jgi:hypothetical protein
MHCYGVANQWIGGDVSTWFSRRVLDLLGWIDSAYYARKYGSLAHRLGRETVESGCRPGFIILQLDGLSYEHFREAVRAGSMPYVCRLLDEGLLTVSSWRCGVPSTTPAVQAGIMFGNRFDIPGFRWYEKESRTAFVARRPDQVRMVRSRIGQGRPGILQDGSCYVSVFDGDAALALFTLSSLSVHRFFESVRGFGFLLLFLLSPFRVLRVIGQTIVAYVTGLLSRLLARLRPRVVNPFDVLSPLLHAASDTLFTEVETFGVMLDIYRGVPAIYANYNSYDEVAHKLGAASGPALRVLRGIDRRVQQIDRMRRRFCRQEYDLYLLSDHGNSDSIPFSSLTGVSLGKRIARLVGSDLSVEEYASQAAASEEKRRYVLEELRDLKRFVSPRLRTALAAVHHQLERNTRASRHAAYDLARHRDVIVSVSGPLAHVYFNVSVEPLELADIVSLYPQLVDRLIETDGIGVVAGRAAERTVILGNNGGTWITGGSDEIHGPQPLGGFEDAEYLGTQIHQLSHFPHAGDLVVIGAKCSDGRVVTFEEQAASHGGWGGPQGYPFIAWPPRRHLPVGEIKDAEDLYSFFSEYRLGNVK